MGAGAGFNALAQAGAQAGLDKIQRKRDATDEERRGKAEPLIAGIKQTQANLPQIEDLYGKDSQQYKDATQKLANYQQAFDELYHPIKAPGAIAQDFHWLAAKVHGIGAPKDKTPPSTTSQTPEIALNTPAAPIASPELPAYQQTTPALPSQGGAKTTDVPGVAATSGPGMNAVPKGATPTMAVAKPQGLLEAGNIPIWNRPSVLNDDGTHSSELSISIGDDKGNETLIPLIVDGKFLTPNGKMPAGEIPHNAQEWEKASPEWKALKMRAEQHYKQTGQHLGKFGGGTPEENQSNVEAYAQVLHNRGSASAAPVVPAGAPVTVTKAPPVPWGQAQVLKQKAAAMQKAQQEAGILAAGAPLSPEQTAMATFRANEAVNQAQIDATLKTAEKLGITGPALDELKQQLVGLKNITPKPLTGAAGAPYKGPDGLYRQAVSNPDGTVGFRYMPPDWKPNTKAVRGTLLNTKKYGFIQTWVDPYDPSKITGWQKVTPSRYYQGTTTSKTSTDSLGVTTTSSGTTMPANSAPIDIDLSGAEALPDDFNGDESSTIPATTGQPSAPKATIPVGTPASVSKPVVTPTAPSAPKTSAKPSDLKKQIPAPPSQSSPSGTLQVDAAGHIPEGDAQKYGYNSGMVQIANNILDGEDTTKLSLKDRGAAEQLASKYGWSGQGLFTPKDKLLLKESATYLDKAMKDPSMKVLDSKESRIKIANAIHAAGDNAGIFSKALAVQFGLTPEENNFVSTYLQLIGTISGLGQLTRGGRMTEATAKRLMNELPNPLLTPNSAAGIDKLKRLRSEIDVATQKGSFDLSSDTNKGAGNSVDDLRKKFNIPLPITQ